MLVHIESKHGKGQYQITRMSEYYIETTLDIPADHFNIVIENPVNEIGKGGYGGLLQPNDSFKIIENNGVILDGIADDIKETWNDSGSTIEITGRDKSLLLLDNDAAPRTYNRLKYSEYVRQITSPYGFTQLKIDGAKDTIIEKIVIESGDSLWDSLNREAERLNMKLWCEANGTIVAEALNYKKQPIYRFSNQLGDAVKIKQLQSKRKGSGIRGEVWVRGHGGKAFLVKHQDEALIKEGYTKRAIINQGQAKNIAEAEELAQKYIRDRVEGSYEIEITINGRYPVKINETAYVKDSITNTEGVFFIVGIKHRKNARIGQEKIIRLRPLGEGL